MMMLANDVPFHDGDFLLREVVALVGEVVDFVLQGVDGGLVGPVSGFPKCHQQSFL